ncbi:MAG: sodium-translocating pyrophosphatase [Firmicutes bacterium HGW-Firmicutes-5]|nr:MAG: sodium-translocating pyrophosphatase [Firmicutes bacterium HGW-Firmicutes-5]
MIALVFFAVFLALTLAAYNFKAVKKLDPGTDLMKEIAAAIQEGADAFIRHEYSIIAKIALLAAIILSVVVDWYVGVTFLMGASMSALAGFIGMRIATISNVRVSNTARTTKSLGATLKVAFQGGSVMGLSVGGFALLGLGLVYIIFGKVLGQTDQINLVIKENWIGVHFIPYTMTVSGYALGCSIIAMFDRVGGGIYTKAADMGADLVGKTEAGIPEDDPRNPATIADNVGDNVGDVAGLGADLLESFVGALISAIVLVSYMYYTTSGINGAMDFKLVENLLLYPLLFAAIGLVSCVIGILSLIFRKVSDNPHRELNYALWVSAGLTVVATGIFTNLYFKGMDVSSLGFKMGIMSPWIAAVFGIGSGILIGFLAEYYTSYDFKPTLTIAQKSMQGTALTITQGLASGMKSTLFPVIVLALATLASNYFAGLYGVAMAAIGMLSFVAATVSVDTYGPIADNAGGICEMSKLAPEVRKITDKLDSVGNTTAAIGKGFAIGSASLAALSLLASYLYSQTTMGDTMGFVLNINMINTLTLAGALVGAALPFYFSGLLIESVAKAAGAMVDEVRRQFREMPGILTGETKPDYKRCIEISSAGALKEMTLPAMISVLVPIGSGFIFGEEFVGGMLIGTLLSAIMLALFTANSGGAWDNAKKLVESGEFEGQGKGSELHASTVIGDTVGDPLKDTVGPSLDILIKIMAMVSLIMVSVFSKYNLLELFK